MSGNNTYFNTSRGGSFRGDRGGRGRGGRGENGGRGGSGRNGGNGANGLPSGTSTNANSARDTVQTYAQAIAKNEGTDPNNNTNLQAIKYNHGLRDAFQARGPASTIATNYFDMTTPTQVYVYSIEMARAGGQKVHKRADRKLIFDQFLGRHHSLNVAGQPRHWATDYQLIWSTVPLFNIGSGGRQLVVPLPVGNNPGSYPNECGELLQVQQLNIYYESTIPCDLQQFNDPAAGNDKNSRPGILLRGFNAFLSDTARSPGQNIEFTSGSKGFDTREAPTSLQTYGQNNALVALSGFSLSARPGISNFLVNMNTATSAFFARMTVQDFLNSVGARMTARQQLGLLKGVKVRITYNVGPPNWAARGQRTEYRFIRDISGLSVSQQRTINNPNQTISQWYQDTNNNGDPFYPSHPINIAKNTASIKIATSSGDTMGFEGWYPATALEIVGYQRFGSPLSSDATSKMINAARMFPSQSVQRITGPGLRIFGLQGQAQAANLTAKFGMTVGSNMLQIPGHWLQIPQICYNGVSKPASNASWDLQRVTFKNCPGVSQLFALNLTGRSGGMLSNNIETLRKALAGHGIGGTARFQFHAGATATTHPIHDRQPTPQYETVINQFLNELPGDRLRAVMLVLIKEKNQDQYAFIKRVAELQVGIQTVFCVQDEKRLKAFNRQAASNIALKFNMRSAGVNHDLGTQGFAALKTPKRVGNTIVIGADVTHPPTTASPGTPSIAAVVGTTDNDFMHFPGSMRLQRGRQEDIVELGDMVKERLIDWAEKHNGQLPANMLFYRDGVSESQYDRVRLYEIPQIQQAYNWAREYLNWRRQNPPTNAVLDTQRDPWPVPVPRPGDQKKHDEVQAPDFFEDKTNLSEPFNLTYVVVGKRHNTRFYALQAADADLKGLHQGCGNARPGLVVDQVITHPHSLDFYLQSHQAIIGTGRSAHYFTLTNNMQFSADELQRVTHDFCYAYARATKGVSYCAPAYYADRLCDRGRAYLRHWLTRRDDPDYRASRPIMNRNLPQGVPPETFTQYNDFVKNDLRDRDYYRPAANRQMKKYGFTRRNPWHPNMDGVMFYL